MTQENTPGKGGFVVGHPRYGGRKKNSGARAREILDSMGPRADPLRFLYGLVADGVYTRIEVDENGKKTKHLTPVPLELRIDCARTLAGYVYPKLSSVSHTGADGEGPIETQRLELKAILASPELCKAAQDLALALCDRETGPVSPGSVVYPGLCAPVKPSK